MDQEKVREALRKDIQRYSNLKQLKSSPDFEHYLDFLTTTAAAQMLNAFLGAKAPTLEDFVVTWGEVRAKLHTLQEVGGADLIEKQLIDQLKQYNNPPS